MADLQHRLSNDTLSAAIKAEGAELISLKDLRDREYVWQARPEWPRHSPVLFPIVGRLKDDRLTHHGVDYRLTQHGFARDRRFQWLESDAESCRLVLEADDATRALYPFAFRLELLYRLTGNTLSVTYVVCNTGKTVLPASIGAHPAFVWPLSAGIAKTAHRLTFEAPEPAAVRRLSGGLLLPDAEASPIDGRELALDPALFERDALILDQVASSSVRYTAPGEPGLTVAWHGMTQLGLWTKPGDFLCIEPWHGYASPIDFAGEFEQKPGLMLLAPDEERQLGWSVTVEAA